MALTIEPAIKFGNKPINQIVSIYDTPSPHSFYHQSNIPFMIVLMTVHPNQSNDSVFTVFTPDMVYNCPVTQSIKNHDRHAFHQHNCYEFTYILRGSMYQNVEGKRYLYTPGSCSLLNKNTYHSEEYTTDFSCIFFTVSDAFIKNLLDHHKNMLFSCEHGRSNDIIVPFFERTVHQPDSPHKGFLDFVPLITETEQKQMVHDLFEKMLHIMLEPYYGATYHLMDYFCRLIDILCDPVYYNAIHIKADTNTDAMLFARINQLLEANNGRISNKELSEQLHYSGSYIGRIVKQHTGLSLYNYSLQFTMKVAAKMLLESDITVTNLMEYLKFTNRTHFYNLFKSHYGVTPSNYRKSTELL